jgi:DNA polymerase-3 subunit alpha (Gram-positive type)
MPATTKPPFTLFDLETTGVHNSDAIIQIAAVRSDGRAAGETFCTLVRPHRPIPAFITELTGITPGQAAAAPQLRQALPRFLEFAGASLLVAHNANFDVRFLQNAFARLNPRPAPRRIHYMDTLQMSRALHPARQSHTLDALAGHCQIPLPANRHDALADSLLLAGIFHRLMARLRQEDSPFAHYIKTAQLGRAA